MLPKIRRVRLIYIVLGVLLLVGLLPLALAGTLLSGRSAEELRAIEGRYQAQLVQDKARQIELYGQRYRTERRIQYHALVAGWTANPILGAGHGALPLALSVGSETLAL